MTRQPFHVLQKGEGILTAFQSGRGHAIPGLRKAVPENPTISPLHQGTGWDCWKTGLPGGIDEGTGIEAEAV